MAAWGEPKESLCWMAFSEGKRAAERQPTTNRGKRILWIRRQRKIQMRDWLQWENIPQERIQKMNSDNVFFLFKIMKQRGLNLSTLSASEETNSMEKTLIVTAAETLKGTNSDQTAGFSSVGENLSEKHVTQISVNLTSIFKNHSPSLLS